uniref:ACB domain-containing protein n=1 Tax=Rhabditophanes sp. KR3021 TaxID=114890 RepID=A0AC35U2F6_9BILA
MARHNLYVEKIKAEVEGDISDLVKVQMAYQDFIDLHSEPLPETNEYIVMLKKMIEYYTEETIKPEPLPRRRMGGWSLNVDENEWPLTLKDGHTQRTVSNDSMDDVEVETEIMDVSESMGNVRRSVRIAKNLRSIP